MPERTEENLNQEFPTQEQIDKDISSWEEIKTEEPGDVTKDLKEHKDSSMLDHKDGCIHLVHFSVRLRAMWERIFGEEVADTVAALNTFKGSMSIVLTNYTGVGKPAIAANGACEINGSFYSNSSEMAITGATANTTWYDILLTPSGSTYTASFIARGTGVWSDSKQGLYSGNNRVVACAYRDSSDADWINKNILRAVNRTVKVKMEIGDWDMNTDPMVSISHGLTFLNIRFAKAAIRNDTDALMYFCVYAGAVAGDVDIEVSLTPANVGIVRLTGGFFDSAAFDSTPFNRGWITIEYEV